MPEWNTLPIDGDDLIDATVTVDKLAPLAAAAPAVAGQVLVATSPTTWAWVDPPSGGTPTSVKTACRLLAFSNVALTGLAGIDGVVPNDGDRILCVGQTPGTQNGIYIAAAGAWSRAPDANTDAEVMAGLFTFITEGTQFGDTGWVLTTNDPIVLDTTALVFAQFSGTGTAIAGNGLTRTGNTFDVVASADGSIVVGPDSVAVGVLNTDAQHGVRGGGNQHADATLTVSGFFSGLEKRRLANTTIDFKDAVRVATPTSSASLSGLYNLDGVDLAEGDRVLVKNQGTPADNGIYLASAGAWTRAPDAVTGNPTAFLTFGMVVPVILGTLGGGTMWAVTTEGTLNAFTPINFTQIAGGPSTATPQSVAAVGSAGGAVGIPKRFSYGDHVHAHGAQTDPAMHAPATVAANGFMTIAQVTKLGATGVLSNQPPATLSSVGATEGTSGETSRSDHAHVVNIGVPVAVGANNLSGSGPNLALNDHVHAHGLQTAGNMHAVATTSVNGFMSSAHVTKLDSLATGQAATLGRVTVDVLLQTPTALAYAATLNIDCAVKNDHAVSGALTGALSVTFTNPAAGRAGTFAVRQDATGGRVVTFAAPGGWTLYRDPNSDLVATTAANSATIYTWMFVAVGGLNMLRVDKHLSVTP